MVIFVQIMPTYGGGIVLYECQSCGYSYFQEELDGHAVDQHNTNMVEIR